MTAGIPTGVNLTPNRLVAPVGSEVVLVAGVHGPQGMIGYSQQLEWMLSRQGVGQIVAVGDVGFFDALFAPGPYPKKVDNTFALGRTSPRDLTLTRGTVTPTDDVSICRGQGWVSLTSAVEGTSYVTVFAPDVPNWAARQQSGTVLWVDAELTFPAAANSQAGTAQLLSTAVVRRTDRAPIANWVVRYEIIGGPEAGFGRDRAQFIELPSNAQGQANVELVQVAPANGTNTVRIDVTRPGALLGPREEDLLVASGTTTITWSDGQAPVVDPNPTRTELPSSRPPATLPPTTLPPTTPPSASQPLTVNVTPTTRAPYVVGQDVSFEIAVTNRGNVPATKLLIVDRYDRGLVHAVASSPIEKDIPDLQPGESKSIFVTFRIDQAGRLCNAVEVTGENGLTARGDSCITAQVPAVANPAPPPYVPREPEAASTPAEKPPAATPAKPSLAVRMNGPATNVALGQQAEFTIDVTNNGGTTLTNLIVTDTYDPRLDPLKATDGHKFETNSLVWRFPSLAPGKTLRLQLLCNCPEAGAAIANRVIVNTAEGVTQRADAAVNVERIASELTLSVIDTADPVSAGKEVTYLIRVTNVGRSADKDVALTIVLPPQMSLTTIGTTGPTRHAADGQNVRFSPVRELAPNETLNYRVRMKANQAGDVRVRAVLGSSGLPRQMSAEETTNILPQ